MDTIAREHDLSRGYHETDPMLRIKLYNAIKTLQARGSQSGIETEMSHLALVTPYIRENALVIGVDPIGTGFAIGGVGAEWIQFWNDTPLLQANLEDLLKAILPISIYYGIDYVDAYNATAGFKSHRESDFTALMPAPTGPTATLAAGGTLPVGTTQYYVITALDEVGETVQSAEVSATPTAGNQTIDLGWNPVRGASSYKVYRSTVSGTYTSPALAGNPTTNSFSDNGVTLTAGSPPGSTTATAGILTNFAYQDNGLVPTSASATYESGVIDLASDFANWTWLVDWVDYIKWNVKHTLTVEVQFSSDGYTGWSPYTAYSRNGEVSGATVKRYAGFKITLTMTSYDALTDYMFRSFALKGLTSDQALYQ